jgi:hypothetical protein
VIRSNFSAVMEKLESHEIQYVYCTDPMLQWNIVFASEERILARWISPQDRIPAYSKAVDEARLSGKPIAFISLVNATPPMKFGVVLNPLKRMIDENFPLSPGVAKSASDVGNE